MSAERRTGRSAEDAPRAFLLATALLLAVLAPLVFAGPARAQTLSGRVLDGANDEAVPYAALYLFDRDRTPVATALADSLGRYLLDAPAGGEFVLVAQRFGYLEVESPLVAISDGGRYELDFELQPEPLGLNPITVTVRNEDLVDWLTLELGVNPVTAFGFRILQGPRLQEAKIKGKNHPTETLRWLYIPVWHQGSCVSVNSTPRPQTVGYRGARVSQAPTPGGVPVGTRTMAEAAESASAEPSCGSLFVNERRVPNELIEEIDMEQVAVVVTLPGQVRMYTYEFDWAFR